MRDGVMEEERRGGQVPLPSSLSSICKVCPSPSPAAVGGRACAALHPPGGGPRRGEGGPRQALPPLSATGPHLESHQGRLSKPASDADHPFCHQKWISPCLPPASVGPLASCHPALRLRQTGTGVLLPPEVPRLHRVQLTGHQLHCAPRACSPQKSDQLYLCVYCLANF